MTRLRSGAQGAVPEAGASLSQQVAGEVGRMREARAHLIEFSGMSRREVEQRLCQRGCGTDLGRLLSGRLDLKMDLPRYGGQYTDSRPSSPSFKTATSRCSSRGSSSRTVSPCSR